MIASAHAVQVKLESEKILERAFQENQVFIHVTDYVYFSITTSSIWGQSHSSIYTTHTVHIMLWEKGDAVLFKSEIWAIQYANPCCLLRYWATLLDTSAQSSSLVSLALRLHPMIHTCTGLWVGSGGPLSRGWGGQSPGHTTQETLPEPPLLCLLPSWWTTLVCTFYFFAQILFFTQKLSKSFYVLYTLTSLTTQSKRQTTLLSHTLLILSKHAGSNTCAHPLSLSYVNLCSMRAVPGTRCYITTVVVDNDPIPRSISIPTYV